MEKRHSDLPHDPDATYKWHWGYGWETLPCTKNEAYCGYMKNYWEQHDNTMFFTFVLWWVIAGIMVTVGIVRHLPPKARKLRVYLRRFLLPHGFGRIFPHVSRLQITVLGMVVIYLTVFSFAGMVYKGQKYQDGNKTRTALGWWSNRVGSLAYALTPLTILLSTRDNLFSLITGIGYQHFNFLHRWLGRIIFVQSLLHTIGWTVIQGRLYEPDTQPNYLKLQWQEKYYYMGFFAQIWIAALFVLSLRPVITKIGYEAFRKSHYITAMLFVGGCWGHWEPMKEWLVASLAIFFFDRLCRTLRILLIHFNLPHGFTPAPASIIPHHDADNITVVTLRVTPPRPLRWFPGQHVFLTFPSINLLQAHPFTPAAVAASGEHTYIIAALSGATARLAAETEPPVVICGSYGSRVVDKAAAGWLLVAGGTGISFVLPIARERAERGRVRLVWVVRRETNVVWADALLEELLEVGVEVVVYVSRAVPEREGSSVGEEKDIEKALEVVKEMPKGKVAGCVVVGRPEMRMVVQEWVKSAGGRSQVLASGPEGMGTDLRTAVAEANKEGDVGFYWDGRYY